MGIGLWLLVAVLAVAFAYMQFTTATLDHGQRTRRQHHEKRIPRCHHSTVADEPRVSRIRRNSHSGAGNVVAGWPSALAGMVAIFVGSLVAGFIGPQASGGHYQRLILRSMLARYANYVRDGDVVRAEAHEAALDPRGNEPRCWLTHHQVKSAVAVFFLDRSLCRAV